MNYKIIRENEYYNLKIGDIFIKQEKQDNSDFDLNRNNEYISGYRFSFVALLHKAGYLEPIPERIVLKLEVEFEKINGKWDCNYKNILAVGNISFFMVQHLDKLLAESEAQDG